MHPTYSGISYYNNNNNNNNNNNGKGVWFCWSEMFTLHRFPIWFAKVMEKLANSWNTRIVAQTTQGKEISPTIRFKKGLPQGDALCPMLFILCLNPIAWKVRATEGYRLSKPISTIAYILPSPCTAFSQSLSVNSFQWRIRDEQFSHGPRDPKRFGREEKWGLGTRQAYIDDISCLLLLRTSWNGSWQSQRMGWKAPVWSGMIRNVQWYTWRGNKSSKEVEILR